MSADDEVVKVNAHGVPQYPKGHAGRLLITLAAIDKLDTPTATSVATLTGLSKSKIDEYAQTLCREFGVDVVKIGGVFRIQSWGEVLRKSGVQKALTVPLNGTRVGETHDSFARRRAMITERKPMLSNADHRDMDEMLKEILAAVAAGELSPRKAVGGLAQVIAAVDCGNLGEAQAWFKNKLGHFAS
ncbi:hypothetical protein [Pseudomonas syringae]|uniref:hypothetical protein n=1 Tax=Pseudomonas syringae TaxID=317 RepID=UPI0019671BD3|nr:hypothetical protein [Pseudomonas syringae]